MANGKARYLEARVADASTVGDAYRHYDHNPDSFVAGAQYALDVMLRTLDQVTVNTTLEVEYSIALEILERAKRGQPQ